VERSQLRDMGNLREDPPLHCGPFVIQSGGKLPNRGRLPWTHWSSWRPTRSVFEAQARQAVDVVVSLLKDRLPEPLTGQIDATLAGRPSGLSDVAGGLGGLVGKK
jgi:hypothetical protein